MPYPFSWTDDNNNTIFSYADIPAVQDYFVTYRIDQSANIGISVIQRFLESVTAEMDALLLRKGYIVPPPAGARILPILREIAAIGAAALAEHARFEDNDANGLLHANGLMNSYDSAMGQIERDEINPGQLGVLSAGWSEQPDMTKYFASGNLQPLADETPVSTLRTQVGSTRAPFFTMNMRW